VGGTLFFKLQDGNFQQFGLWKSDGTPAGTVLVKRVNVVGGVCERQYEDYCARTATNVNGTLFFNSLSATAFGGELWKSDGTAAGTIMVKQFVNSGHPFLEDMTNSNGTLFFTAWEPTHGLELWKSDGTAAGTAMVKDTGPDYQPYSINGSGDFADLTNVNGALFFRWFDGTHGGELWTSDGTAAGTKLVKDLAPGPEGSSAYDLTNVDGTLFFGADDGTHGIELWKTKPRIQEAKPKPHR
jgi:ELWxxDGT repeat protein